MSESRNVFLGGAGAQEQDRKNGYASHPRKTRRGRSPGFTKKQGQLRSDVPKASKSRRKCAGSCESGNQPRNSKPSSISIASVNIKNIMTYSNFLQSLLSKYLFVFVQEHWLYNYQSTYMYVSQNFQFSEVCG